MQVQYIKFEYSSFELNYELYNFTTLPPVVPTQFLQPPNLELLLLLFVSFATTRHHCTGDMTKHRYVSIIPKPPKGQNSYNAYVKENFNETAKQYPDMQRPQIMNKLGEAFKALSESEAEKYKQIAERHRQAALAEWSKGEAERDAKRIWWCKKLDLPTSASWEDVDRANKRKVKAAQADDSDSDVATGGPRTSSQRKATATAREKIKSQHDLEDSDDERPRKRTSLLSSAASTAGSGKSGSLKKRQSRLGDVEWVEAVWGQERVAAVNRAIDRYSTPL